MSDKNELPKVAVLLAAYNGERFIEEQINSILNQDSCEISVYVSLDHSIDGSEALIGRLSSQHDNVFFLPYGERYGSASKNFFRLFFDVDVTGYDYVALSDQDDIWLPGKISRGLTVIKNRGVSGYSSDMTAFWENGKQARLKKSFPIKRFDHFMESGGAGCTSIIPASVAEDFAQFLARHLDEISGITKNHDWLLYAYVKEKYGSWFIDDESYILYRQHDSNEIGMNKGFSAILSRFKMIKSKWYREQVILMSSVIQRDLDKRDFSPTPLFIIKNLYHCRRRPRDVLILFFLLMLNLY